MKLQTRHGHPAIPKDQSSEANQHAALLQLGKAAAVPHTDIQRSTLAAREECWAQTKNRHALSPVGPAGLSAGRPEEVGPFDPLGRPTPLRRQQEEEHTAEPCLRGEEAESHR